MEQTGTTMDMMNMMDLFMIATGVYVLYNGIMGKGKAYEVETIHPEKKADFNKAMRIFCLIGGALSILTALSSMLDWPQWVQTAFFILLAVAILAIIVAIVPMDKERYDKKKSKDKQQKK